jgi:SnoaL-like domain
MAERSTKEVFEDHLRLRKQDDPETDIERNYAEDVVVMSNFGIFHGRDGVRHSEQLLHQQLPSGRHYSYVYCLTDQDIAYERWDGESGSTKVRNGIDFFLIRNGLIKLQLIYYQPIPK